MSDLDQSALKQPPLPIRDIWRYEAPPAPSSLYDIQTQAEVLGRLLLEPRLLRESFGDLTVSDFVGSTHQSLFRAMLKLSHEGTDFDIVMVAEAWDGNKEVGYGPAYLTGLLDGVPDNPSAGLRHRADKLHKLSHLRRLRGLGELLQRHAESANADPNALMEKLQIASDGLRAGYDLSGEMLPYAPRNLARRPDLISLSSVEAQPIPWLWRPYLAYGMLSLLSGEPGAGKTYLALAFAASLTAGRVPYIGEPCLPLDVIYLSTENPPEFVVRKRFDLLEGNANRCHILQGAVTGEGEKARREGVRLSDISLLESALKQTNARFLVVDPIQSYLGGEVDMHRSNETRPILDGLAVLAKKYQACILILRHFAKSTAGSAINRGLGSIDLTGAARTEMHAGTRDEQHVMAHAKTNIGELGKSLGYEINGDGVFRWTGESSLTANELASASVTEEDREGLNEAKQCLEDMLKAGAKLSSEILAETKDLGFSSGMVRRAKAKLGVKSRKKSGQRYGQFEWYLDGYEDGEVSPS